MIRISIITTRLQRGKILLFTIDQLTCPYTCIQLLSVPGSRRIGTGWLTLNTNLIQSLIIQFYLLLVLSRWSKRFSSIQQHFIYESLIIHHQQNALLIHRIRHLTSIHYCSRFHTMQIQIYLYRMFQCIYLITLGRRSRNSCINLLT